MASVHKVGKNKWCAMYRYETQTGDRKQKKVSGFRSKEEAWETARLLEKQSNAGIDVTGDRMTCSEIMKLWYDEHCIGLSINTKAKYAAGIENLSHYFISDFQVRKLRAAHLYLLIDELRKSVSDRTAISYAEPLRLSINWAFTEGLIPRNPLCNVRLKIPKREHRILDEEAIASLVEASAAGNFRIPLLLALYGGLRREECAGLRWESVDFQHNHIVVSHVVILTPDGKEYCKEPKTVLSARTIAMPSWIMAELRKAYDTFLSRPASFTMSHNPQHRVCVSGTGDPYSCHHYSQATRRMIQKINQHRLSENILPIPNATFHDLRHTHVAMLIRLGFQPKIIAERLGHASIKTTMDTYGYLMPGMQYLVTDALNREYRKKHPEIIFN